MPEPISHVQTERVSEQDTAVFGMAKRSRVMAASNDMPCFSVGSKSYTLTEKDEALVEARNSGQPLKLIRDLEITSYLSIPSGVDGLVFDLNGYSIKNTNASNAWTIVVFSKNVTILNSKESIGGKISSETSGIYVASNASATVGRGITIEPKTYGFYMWGEGTLDGGKITALGESGYGVVDVDGTFIMKDCSIEATVGAIIMVYSKDVYATISGGTITTTGKGGYGVGMFPEVSQNNASYDYPHYVHVNISGGTITGKNDEFALAGNGSQPGTEVSITGGTLISTHHAIYHPQDGTISIGGNAVIKGGRVGIEMRAGTLNVSDNATIIGGSPESSGSGENNSGTTSNNAAIAVAQHTTKKKISVNITGGTMSSTSALYVSNPQNNDNTAGKVSVKISEGTDSIPRFNGDINITDTRVPVPFISGGLYTKRVNDQYIETDYENVNTLDTTYKYRVGKYIAPENKPAADVPAPMPEKSMDVTENVNKEAAAIGMTVDKLDIGGDVSNLGIKEEETATGVWYWAEVKPDPKDDKGKTQIENMLKDSDEVAVWLDVSLYKQTVMQSSPERISATKEPITVRIQLDSKLLLPRDKQKNYRYVVYRYHDGKVERLETSFDPKTNTLTFSTDKFSTYALVYEEIPVEPEVTPVPVVPDMPQTGDGSQLVLFAALLGVSVMGLLLLAKRRRA